MSKPTVGITMGDPAGIGPEIVVKGYRELRAAADVLVIGDADVVESARGICGSDLGVERIASPTEATFSPDAIPVLDLDNVGDLERGVVREDYGRASLGYVERAIELAQAGEIDAMTTAPINKQSTKLAGSEHAGHTGMLADYTDTENYSMMLIEDDLRVTHVSTHVPLREACDLVGEEVVLDTVRVTDEALRELGVEEPTVAVAGLNPHASDGGLLGAEDGDEIEPAVSRAREEGIDAFGPESPDTVYVQAARGAADCVVSMYHDQGHIPIKMLGFAEGGAVSGVNVTIGLPIVRTSVDHGTAFDIAGEGIASERSLLDAVAVAGKMARDRTRAEAGEGA
ncbi:4-hydroxythreonine-4-phosphate dehydrogenase PdxA [Halalkalicoccus jeotgali]|uniref:4-hydroxythreonine-4-phosphate dehydrogenase n=1 Tax=Halalkalicoccus jeotgali (strain DSM 18796 / CECT 7217 / JCM 14584 / KCTC 4019 / B3) TaxID=795797 RepID=D8JA34_HALJB|nr:4-hydroxythreonine-4-phosphate dehydrogenase PdxA [Halalkalicoccus jeotgali]ADJ14556.1 4-hydroxythreonine-4-phosphate dehydrogenase [Halalkalicoccus jeotgali B3]ELY39928.1 4-hydroxythreonine-4-phosphate dehydrogenase [Halalkalicoccus jeotgali B3]